MVRPSDWNSAHVQNQTISGNTVGVSSFSGTNIVFQGGNNVTLSAATAVGAATIVISGANTVAQSVQTQASGAIAGTGFTSTTTAGTNITAALGTNGLSMAVPAYLTTYAAQTTQTQPAGNIAGAGYTSTTQAGSTVGITQNSNGLSAAWPAFITTATQSTQTQASGAIAGTGFTSTTTAGTAVTAALGTNGLSMAVPAFITTYVAQTTQTQPAGNIAGAGYTSTTQAGSTVGITQNSNGLSAAWPPYITTYASQTADTNKAGTGSTTAATNASLTLNVGTNGVALSANISQGDANAWNLVGANTAGTTGTTLTTQGPFYLSGGNNVTLSGNSNTIVISAGAGGVTNQTGPNIAVAGSTITSGTVLFSNANGVSFGIAGSTITATVADPTISYYDLYELGDNSVWSSYGQNSLHFQIFVPGMNLTMTGINMLASMSSAASNASMVVGQTMSYGIYSQGSGTNSTRLESMATSSFFINAFASSNVSASYAVGQVGSSFTTSSAGTVVNSVITGAKALQLPFVTSLASSGYYAFCFANSTSSVGNTGAMRVSHAVMTDLATTAFGLIYTGGMPATNTSVTQEFQQLVWSTTSGAWPATIAYSNLSNNGASVNHAFAYFNA